MSEKWKWVDIRWNGEGIEELWGVEALKAIENLRIVVGCVLYADEG